MIKGKFKIVTESRSDAIGLYGREIIRELSKLYNVKVVNFLLDKNSGRVRNFLRYSKDLYLLIISSSPNDIFLFFDPLSVKANAVFLLRGKKFILVHHLAEEPPYYKPLPFLNMKILLNAYDGIICDSNFSQKQLNELGVTTKSTVIYGGVNKCIFNPGGGGNSSLHLPKNYILSIGTELPRKNMYGILKAFLILKKDHPELKLLKVGVARKQDRNTTINFINKFKLNNDVIFANYISEDELPSYYHHAKLLLFPSFLEGFGLPILEAMACGCPVVTSNRGSMKELAGEEQLLVDPKRPRDIAEKCTIILTNHKKRRELIKAGVKRAKLFNWKRTAMEIYKFVTSK